MKIINQQLLTGERALFGAKNMEINYSTFVDGESPLKESENIKLYHCNFRWKYPLWYSNNATLLDCTLFEMARAGIWYTQNIALTNCIIEAPKAFRKSTGIQLNDVTMINAEETLWNCDDIIMRNVTAKGNYFAMNSKNIKIDGFQFVGDYSFDGCSNIEIHNARMLSKDAFWNCDNVTVYDSYISGEYLGWNSKNITLVNCTIESTQGMCYIENIVLKDCQLINTDLAFEYSTVTATLCGTIDSVKNPYSGSIEAEHIGKVIFDDPKIRAASTIISTGNSTKNQAS